MVARPFLRRSEQLVCGRVADCWDYYVLGVMMFRTAQASYAFRAELARALADTEWGDKSRRYFLTREEEHVGGLKAATAIWSVTSHSDMY